MRPRLRRRNEYKIRVLSRLAVQGGRDQVMLLSHGLWQRRYGGDRGIVGQTIAANGTPYTVVGVMPAGFEFPHEQYQFWVPFAPFATTRRGWSTEAHASWRSSAVCAAAPRPSRRRRS